MTGTQPVPPVIEASGLASGYGGKIVWSGADFSVGPGEFLTVLGPNGAGKSTLLRMVLGLLAPAGGTLRVFGGPPERGNPAIGYVPQRRALDPDLSISAEDIVGLGVDGHRWGVRISPRAGRQRREAVAGALAAVGASGYARRAVCPAVSSSGCSWPRRWSPTPGCCCSTSRWPASTCAASRR
jgi:zinc/manganese transport system ATP-binding protein